MSSARQLTLIARASKELIKSASKNALAELGNLIQSGTPLRQAAAQGLANGVPLAAFTNVSQLGNQDRAHGRQVQRDAVGDQRFEQQFDFRKQRAEVGDQRFERQFDFKKQRAASVDARADRAFNVNQSDRKFNRSVALRRLSIAEKQAAKTSDPNAILSVRQQAAESVGLDQNSPEYKAYILTGRLPKPSSKAKAAKTTVDNAKASGFARRAIASNKIIGKPESIEAATSVAQRAAAFIPVIGNFLVDPNFQKFDQAQRDFINAQLRRESGAVISDAEFDNAEKQYFPQPGDRPEVIEQKNRNRQNAITGLVESAGPLGSQFQENAPQAQGAISDGATATNPQTGEKIIFQNGQWMPAQ